MGKGHAVCIQQCLCVLPLREQWMMFCAGAPGAQGSRYPAPDSSSGFGPGAGTGLPQGLAASMGMSSQSSMSDPLGWMGPTDARNTGKLGQCWCRRASCCAVRPEALKLQESEAAVC